jgi:hypothetical protein
MNERPNGGELKLHVALILTAIGSMVLQLTQKNRPISLNNSLSDVQSVGCLR